MTWPEPAAGIRRKNRPRSRLTRCVYQCTYQAERRCPHGPRISTPPRNRRRPPGANPRLGAGAPRTDGNRFQRLSAIRPLAGRRLWPRNIGRMADCGAGTEFRVGRRREIIARRKDAGITARRKDAGILARRTHAVAGPRRWPWPWPAGLVAREGAGGCRSAADVLPSRPRPVWESIGNGSSSSAPAKRPRGSLGHRSVLRSPGVGASLCWPQKLGERRFRQMQLAAEAGGTLGLLVRPESSPRAAIVGRGAAVGACRRMRRTKVGSRQSAAGEPEPLQRAGRRQPPDFCNILEMLFPDRRASLRGNIRRKNRAGIGRANGRPL